ncbi:MAG: hypothetical protein KGL12_01590 [Rhodospirillales bacterium]|nr:hypothetical protein [Rhodospirillales bacterium]
MPAPDAPRLGEAAPAPQAAPWHEGRIAVAAALWGDGFILPGGPDEVLRLARPFGLSEAASVLLLGAGPGGAAVTIAAKLGPWVTACEADPVLVAAANALAQRHGQAKRAQTESWMPQAPVFRAGYYHHALAIEALRGADPAPVLRAMARAVRPGGQMMVLDLVAGPAGPPAGRGWVALERRSGPPPDEAAITREMNRLGLDIRVVEDVSARHATQVLAGWRDAVGWLKEGSARPMRRDAALLVGEAELWLTRLRLMREGRLRLVRWHAIGR